MARTSYQPDQMRLSKARMDLGMTQRDLAAAVGVHPVTVAKVETGKYRVSLETLEKFAEKLGCSRDWLCGEDDEIDPLLAEKERIASALMKFGEALEEIADVLYGRVSEIANNDKPASGGTA